MFHKSLDVAQAGDQPGALIRGVKRDEIRRGMVMIAPGTVKPHKQFKAQVYILTKAEGGRHTPFVSNYQPTLFTRTADVCAAMELPEGEWIEDRPGRVAVYPYSLHPLPSTPLPCLLAFLSLFPPSLPFSPPPSPIPSLPFLPLSPPFPPSLPLSLPSSLPPCPHTQVSVWLCLGMTRHSSSHWAMSSL